MKNCQNCHKEVSIPELIMVSKWMVLDFANIKCFDCQFRAKEVSA